jgi:hypothetical protein
MAETSPQHSNGGLHSDDGLAPLLEPALLETCRGRLSKLEWFRSTWQSGGASTGYGTYTTDDGRAAPVCIKLPVGPSEYNWTTALAASEPPPADESACDHLPTLRVFAAGTELGGYDLAWLVVERLPGQTLTHDLTESGIQGLLRTTARWYELASQIKPIGAPPPPTDWEGQLAKARDALKVSAIDEPQHWNKAIKDVQKALPRLLERWECRPINSWCHGDLHPGNVMRRLSNDPATPAPCVLIDLALVHAGHWVEDAVYFERLHWGRKELLHGIKPVNALAKIRKELGLPHADGEDHGQLANIRRVLMAATTPAFLHREGHPKYVKTALEKLETLLPLVAR